MRCVRIKADGEQCKKNARRGATVCDSHGGRAPQIKRRAAIRVLEEDVRKARLSDGAPGSDEPVDVLAELLRLVREVIDLKDRLTEYMSVQEPVNPNELAVLERAMDRCGKLLVAVAALGLDDRIARVNSETVDRVVLAMRAFGADIGADVEDPAVTAAMAKALRSVT